MLVRWENFIAKILGVLVSWESQPPPPPRFLAWDKPPQTNVMKAISESMTLGALAKSIGCTAVKAVESPKGNSWIAVGKSPSGNIYTLAFLTKKAKEADKTNLLSWSVWEFPSKDGKSTLNGCAPANWSISNEGWVTV